jgi:hypothetical protein
MPHPTDIQMLVGADPFLATLASMAPSNPPEGLDP